MASVTMGRPLPYPLAPLPVSVTARPGRFRSWFQIIGGRGSEPGHAATLLRASISSNQMDQPVPTGFRWGRHSTADPRRLRGVLLPSGLIRLEHRALARRCVDRLLLIGGAGRSES